MRIAVITLSREGAILANLLAQAIPESDVYLHESTEGSSRGISHLDDEVVQPSPCPFPTGRGERQGIPPPGGEDSQWRRHLAGDFPLPGGEGSFPLPLPLGEGRGEDIRIPPLTGQLYQTKRFSSIIALTAGIFDKYAGLVYLAPCGVVVRAVAPCLKHKTADPAVVMVDAGGRFAVSLLSGHEGGANDLAVRVANIIAAEPVISTTTEALKTLIVGIGCRRGIAAEKIVSAVKQTLDTAALPLDEVRFLASADVKADETGLLEAARILRIPLRFIASDEIRSLARDFERSDFVESKVNLPAVAEPSALLAGRRTRLVLPKTVCGGVTVAVARESCLWSE